MTELLYMFLVLPEVTDSTKTDTADIYCNAYLSSVNTWTTYGSLMAVGDNQKLNRLNQLFQYSSTK